MKRIIVCIIFLMVFINFNVSATNGNIKQSSVIKCGDRYYGSHSNPKHWHEVVLKNDKWVINSLEVEEPNCYADIPNVKEEVIFNKCVDGDTFRVTINEEIKTVRFLAIDTPESVHPEKEVEEYGIEASNYTCELLTKASKLYLEYDKDSDREDKYGRLLAFVYADDLMVQKELIKNGYAKVAYLYGDYTYTNELQDLEEKAKENKIGIWNDYQESSDNEKEGVLNKILNFISKILDNIFKFLKNML